MKEWNKYYSEEISWKNYLEKLADHSYYMEKIIDLNPSSTLEVGCGPGTRSVFLSYLGINAKAIDIDKKVSFVDQPTDSSMKKNDVLLELREIKRKVSKLINILETTEIVI